MREPQLDLRVTAPVGTVMQVGRVVLEPAAAPAIDPTTVEALVGRDAELAAVLRAIAAGAPGVVLAGEPGLGTTAVALAAAARLSARYPGGVRFVPLTGSDPDPALRELLRDLGVRPGEIPAATWHRTALLRAVLAGTPTILVLDDAREAAQVRALLPGGASTALVTTCEQVDELHLDGLAAVAVRGLRPAAAALLPSLRAGHDGPALSPEPPASPSDPAAALLAACHGSPLAVRLLMGACRTPTASLRALQAERADRPRDPAAAARAAARIALAALPDVEREVLDAVRATGLPLVDPARCAALLPDGPRVDPLLRALLRRGLLSRRPGPGAGPWCAVPRAVAEVVPTEEPSTVPAALLAVPAPRPAGVDLPTTRHPTDLAALLQRLARHAADRTDPVAGIDALAPLATARTRRDDASAALDRAYAAALDLADRAGDPVLLGRAVHRLAAALAAEPGEAPDRAGLRNARTAFDLAIDLLTGRDDAAHAHALVDRAQLARRRDRAAEALADLHAAIALYRTLGRPVDVASAWQEVAAVERRAGHPCRAVAAHRSALAALVEAGDPTAAGWSRLAAGLVQVGELSEAPDLVAARRPDGPAARSVRELRELDPAAPDWALVAALTSGH